MRSTHSIKLVVRLLVLAMFVNVALASAAAAQKASDTEIKELLVNMASDIEKGPQDVSSELIEEDRQYFEKLLIGKKATKKDVKDYSGLWKDIRLDPDYKKVMSTPAAKLFYNCGIIQIKSTPKGATIYTREKNKSEIKWDKKSNTLKQMSMGKFEVRGDLKGYQPQKTVCELKEAGDVCQIVFEFKK